MGAIMNKRMMIMLAGFIGISPVVQVIASAESMYQDIVQNAINDSLGDPEHAHAVQLYLIEKAIYQVDTSRQKAQSNLIRSHDVMTNAITTYLRGLPGFLGVALIVRGIHNYVQLNGTVGGISEDCIVGAVGLSAYFFDKIEQYLLRKQIKQYNEVIAKLKLKKTELKKKVKIEAATNLISIVEMH
jgi:hypothetical protein